MKKYIPVILSIFTLGSSYVHSQEDPNMCRIDITALIQDVDYDTGQTFYRTAGESRTELCGVSGMVARQRITQIGKEGILTDALTVYYPSTRIVRVGVIYTPLYPR